LSFSVLAANSVTSRSGSAKQEHTMTPEIDVASEFVCLSFIVWGERGAQRNKAAAYLARQDNQ